MAASVEAPGAAWTEQLAYEVKQASLDFFHRSVGPVERGSGPSMVAATIRERAMKWDDTEPQGRGGR